MNKILKLCNSSVFQRVVYSLILLLFVFLFFNEKIYNDLWKKNPLGISFFSMYFVPSIILIYQIIFNNFRGWLSFFILYLFSTTFFTISSIINYTNKEYDNYYILGLIIGMAIVISVFIAIAIFIYLLKPKKNYKLTSID